MPFEQQKFEKLSEEIKEIEAEEVEFKGFEESLEKLIGSERLERVKERAKENLGISINSELLTCEYENKEFIGKTVEEARVLVKEKLSEISEEERRTWEEYLKKSDEEIQKLLKENERNYIEFEKTQKESLDWFLESEIKMLGSIPGSRSLG
jgi:transcriptional regulator of met regulon